ncbi:MAG: TonB-dependent receptor [Rhodobacteraceae bacterium]|nr:TonB-dependent receptor [Paracoccaceae bacterium]
MRPAAPPPAVAVAARPIVVTGAKREAALDALPLAITVAALGDTALADAQRGSTSVAQGMEGMALAGAGPGRNRMFLRGIADSAFSGENQAPVAVILDDSRLTYAAPDPDIRLVDVERVEVLKGPQGSLYGAGALGGVYHIVIRKPELEESAAAASASVSATRQGGIGYSASGVVNLPLARGALATRLVAYTADEPGWVDTGARRDGNRVRLLGLRGAIGAQLGDWRVDATGFAQWLDSRDSAYVYAPGARSRAAQLAEPHDNDLRHLALRIARDSGPVRIVASSGMTWHAVDDTIDATAGAEDFGLADPQTLAEDRSYRTWDSELRFTGTLGGMEWLAGLSHLVARQHNRAVLTGAGGELAIDDERRSATALAAFGNLSVPLFGAVSLDAGARLFRSTANDSRVLPSGEQSFEYHRSGITPALALSWRPHAGEIAYLRYGSAFRQGGSDITATGQLDRLQGDELAMVEAGWRKQFASGARIETGAWYGWWDNLQSDMLQPNGLIETRNAGDARTMGAEASVALPLSRGWTIEAGGNATMAELTRNMTGVELDDRHLPTIPEYTLRGAVEHRFALGGAAGTVRAELRYLGPSRLSFDPAIDRPMGRVLESALEGRITLGPAQLSLGVDNLLGRAGDTFAYGNPLRFATTRQYTPQAPRTVTIALQAGF